MLARTLASARRLFKARRAARPAGATLSAALLKTATVATLIWLGGDVGAAWGDGLRPLAEPPAPVSVSAARLEPTAQGGLRLSLALSQPVETQLFTLSGPDRVVLDLPEVRWGFDPRDVAAEATPAARARGFEGVRVGLFREGRSRLVLDLAAALRPEAPRFTRGPAGVGAIMTLDLTPPERRRAEIPAPAPVALGAPLAPAPIGPAYRGPAPKSAAPSALAQRPAALAIETGAVGSSAVVDAALVAPAPMLDLPPERELRLAPVPRPRPRAATIVIDPGHGGRDPGAHYGGLKEKDLVLAVARELRDELRGSARVRVILTRDRDRYISLDKRVAIAREARAALFVSLHADALPRHPEVAGASFYTLADRASDALAARIAKRENGEEAPAAAPLDDSRPGLRQFLIGYAKRRSESGSESLAREMVANFRGARVPMIKSSPHRRANLRVLRNFDQPSMLVELGFLTNLRDQRRFKNPAWRETAAKAMAASIQRWLRRSERPEGEVVARTFLASL